LLQRFIVFSSAKLLDNNVLKVAKIRSSLRHSILGNKSKNKILKISNHNSDSKTKENKTKNKTK